MTALPAHDPHPLAKWLRLDFNSWVHFAFIAATAAAVWAVGWPGLLLYPALHIITDVLYYGMAVQVFDPSVTIARGYQFSLAINDTPHSEGLDYGFNFYDGDYTKTRAQAQIDKFEHAWEALGLAPGMRVADVGCGCGDWLAWLRDKGVHGVGVNITHAQVEVCRSRGLEVVWSDWKAILTSPELQSGLYGKFDRVTFWDTAEHYVPARFRARPQRSDQIYTDMFTLADNLLSDPAGQVWISCLHVRQSIVDRPLGEAFKQAWWSYILDKFHSGCYPSAATDDLVRNGKSRFKLTLREDLTRDYLMTSRLEETHFGRHRFTFTVKRALLMAYLVLVDPFWLHRFIWLASESWMDQFDDDDLENSDVVLYWLRFQRAGAAQSA
ncbi:MAG: cyclopropane fatty-acyl-phospholipid synthase-like methyltransferase [Myxococcota bacterium]